MNTGKSSEIPVYCRCMVCKTYFTVNGKDSRRRSYCSRKCRDKAFYERKRQRALDV